jgi:hypothetical protein
MPRNLDEQNRHAPNVNPSMGGIQTGNPQIESLTGNDVLYSRHSRRRRRLKRYKLAHITSDERGGGQ